MKNSKLLKFILKLAVTFALVAWLIFKIDWNQFLELLREVSFWGVCIFILVYVASVFFSAFKWKYIAANVAMKMSVWQSFHRYLTGSFINTFLPSTIGGDTYRALALAGKNGSKKHAVATVVMDRISGLVVTVIFAIIFGLSNETVRKNDWLMSIVVMMIVGLICFLLFILFSKTTFAKKIASYFPQVFKQIFGVLQEFNNKKALFSMSFWTALYVFAGPAAVNYASFQALHIPIDLNDFLSVVFMASVIIALPISVGNIGLKEWAYVALFGIFGVAASPAVAVALFGRFLMMLVNAAALPMYLRNKKSLT